MATKVKSYVIRKRGDEYCVLTEDESRTLGCHPTREEAEAQLRAVEANKRAVEQAKVKKFQCTIEGWPIFRAGEWNGDAYAVDDLQSMVDVFTKVGFSPPFKLGHVDDPGAPAVGWVSDLRVDGDALVADIADVDPQVCSGIVNHNYGPPSAEIFWDFERNGITFPRVLGGVALLGGEVPAVAGLPHARDHLTEHAAWQALKTYAVPDGIGGTVRMVPIKEDTIVATETKILTVTVEQMATICPPCAEKMTAKQFKAIKLESKDGGKTYAFPGGMPPEAFDALCSKFAPAEGFRTGCMESGAAAAVDDPGAFCNALKTACQEQGKLSTTQEVKTMTTTTATQTVEKPEKKAELPPADEKKLDSALLQLQELVGLKAEKFEDFKTRMLGTALIPRHEYDALKAQVDESKQKDAERIEKERKAKVDSFAASVLSPRFRVYLHPIYDALLGGPQTAKVKRYTQIEGKDVESEEDVPAMQLMVELGELSNDVMKGLFGEVAVEEIKRAERPAESDPRTEVHERIKDYAQKHNLDPVKNAKEIRDKVFEADPDLKEAYVRSAR